MAMEEYIEKKKNKQISSLLRIVVDLSSEEGRKAIASEGDDASVRESRILRNHGTKADHVSSSSRT